ncbi:MAG: twitch domain-containing radical SAM protein [Candidatus Aminicenantes bacterium]
MKRNTLCIYPWVNVYGGPLGELRLCCFSGIVSNIEKNSIEEFWRSGELKKVRKQMLKGEKVKFCSQCYDLEDTGTQSFREKANNRFANHLWRVEKTSPDGSIDFPVKYLDLTPSNRCNFQCRMCSPVDTPAWFLGDKKMNHEVEKNHKQIWWNPTFIDQFKEMAPNLDALFLSGGEPLMEPLNYKILDILIKYNEDLELMFNTNLSIIQYENYHLRSLFSNFTNVKLFVSIDGAESRGNYIRKGQKWGKLLQNIKIMYPYIAGFKATISVYNIIHFPGLYKELKKNFPGIAIDGFALSDPEFLSVQIFNKSMKSEIERIYKNFIAEEEITEDLKQKAVGWIKFMNRSNKSYLFNRFKAFNDHLDKIYGENFAAVFPELKNWYEEAPTS